MEISNQILDIKTLKPNSLEGVSSKDLKTDDALRSVANDFESFFMNQILEASLKSSSILLGRRSKIMLLQNKMKSIAIM